MVFQEGYAQGLNTLDDLYERRVSNSEFNIFPAPGWGTPPDSHRRLDRLGVAQYSHAYLTTSSDDIPPSTRNRQNVTREFSEKSEVEEVGREDGGISAFGSILRVLERLKESSGVLEGLLREGSGEEEEEEMRVVVGEVDRLGGRLGEWREKKC